MKQKEEGFDVEIWILFVDEILMRLMDGWESEGILFSLGFGVSLFEQYKESLGGSNASCSRPL